MTRPLLDRAPEGLPDGVDLGRVTSGLVWPGDGRDLVGQRDGFGGPQGGQRGAGVAAAEFGVGQHGQVPGSRGGFLPAGAIGGEGLVGLLALCVERCGCFRGGCERVVSCGCL